MPKSKLQSMDTANPPSTSRPKPGRSILRGISTPVPKAMPPRAIFHWMASAFVGTASPTTQSLSLVPSLSYQATEMSALVTAPSWLPSRTMLSPAGPRICQRPSRMNSMALPGPLRRWRKSASNPKRISRIKVAAWASLSPTSGRSTARLEPRISCTPPRAKSMPSRMKLGSLRRLRRSKDGRVRVGRSTITASAEALAVLPASRRRASRRAPSP